MCLHVCLCLASSAENIQRFDLHSLSELQFGGPFRLARKHAKKQEGEPANGGEQRHESTAMANPLLRQILGLV